MQKRNWKHPERQAARLLDLPETSLTDGPTLEVGANREAVLDGCRGILEYTRQEIRIAVREMTLRFTGDDLCICAMDGGSLTIRGLIRAIEFLA